MPLDVITGSWWAPVLIALVIVGSAVFPPLPSDTLLAATAGLALAGELSPALAVLATTAGALLADLTAYTLGHTLSRPTRRQATRATRVEQAVHWLDAHQATWAPGLIIAGRFIPGGTTAVGISAGVLGYPLRRFATAAAAGAVLWTTYGFVVASVGRAVVPDSTWASVLLASLLTLVIAGVTHVVHFRRTRRRTEPPARTPPGSEEHRRAVAEP